jgi:GT2 family glycosyltransferase
MVNLKIFSWGAISWLIRPLLRIRLELSKRYFGEGHVLIDLLYPISHFIESDYITGSALLISRDVIRTIGMLDESFFLYWEDVDWGLRAKKVGFKNLVIPPAHVWHKVLSSCGGMDSLIRVYHKTRSHLLLAKLHARKALPKLHIQFVRDIAEAI